MCILLNIQPACSSFSPLNRLNFRVQNNKMRLPTMGEGTRAGSHHMDRSLHLGC